MFNLYFSGITIGIHDKNCSSLKRVIPFSCKQSTLTAGDEL